MSGLLAGLEQQGLDLTKYDSLIGTSAGATVAAQISSSLGIQELYQRQRDEAKQKHEITPAVNLFKILLKLLPALIVKRNVIKFRQAIGKMAAASKTVSAEQRRQVILDRMPQHEWPQVEIKILAIHATSGQLRVFTKQSNVDFVDAVTASCAVPGIWPSVNINCENYYDGGIRSSENADYAKGAKTALIISPLGLQGNPFAESSLVEEMKLLQDNGSKVELIIPDTASKLAMGKNPLDPSKRKAASESGYRQGLAHQVK